jgi:tetratricopeptide (TPR) repeat protein
MRSIVAACGAALLLASLAAPAALGDEVVLNDGTRLSGTLVREGGMWKITADDGTVTRIEPGRVRSMSKTPSSAAAVNPETLQSRFASLRRSVENVADPAAAIDKYQRFAEQYRGSPMPADFDKDLAEWKRRRDEGLVRYGNQWIAADQFKRIVAESAARAEQARSLIKAGRLREAEDVIKQSLAADPMDVSALYLDGVIAFRRDQLAQARKCFEDALRGAPGHAPSLNNLAVVMYRQRQFGPAMGAMGQALDAAPATKDLLDNAAEVLNGVSDDVRRGNAGVKLGRTFAEQDTALQARMADFGWHRWGSGWVDADQYKQLQEAAAAIQKRIAELQNDFDLTQQRIERIAADIAANERTMRTIENQSTIRDQDGRLIRLAYPPTYYEMQRQNQLWRNDQQELRTRIDALRDAAKKAQAELPKPMFTGAVKLIGEDGVPILSTGPTTQPGAGDPNNPNGANGANGGAAAPGANAAAPTTNPAAPAHPADSPPNNANPTPPGPPPLLPGDPIGPLPTTQPARTPPPASQPTTKPGTPQHSIEF